MLLAIASASTILRILALYALLCADCSFVSFSYSGVLSVTEMHTPDIFAHPKELLVNIIVDKRSSTHLARSNKVPRKE